MQQTIIWTALPAAADPAAAAARLSVFVAVRCDAQGAVPSQLSLFPDFVDWPSTLPPFRVHFAGGPALEARRVGRAPASRLWTRLFHETTPVTSFQFPDNAARIIRSFPVRRVLGFLAATYATQALNPSAKPSAAALTQVLQPIAVGIPAGRATLEASPVAQAQAQLDAYLQAERAFPPSALATSTPTLDFLQVETFHRTPPPGPAPPLLTPEFDFHEMLSALGHHPQVLRALGLVVDLEVRPLAGIPAQGTVWVEPLWGGPRGANLRDVQARTSYTLDGKTFLATPRANDPDLRAGMLRLDGPDYGLIQVDPDGAALKAMNLGAMLLRRSSVSSADTPTTEGLPVLRSAGLSLVRDGRAWHLAQDLQAAQNLDQVTTGGGTPALQAEDVTRGFRIDVWDDVSEKWHSLCRRVGTYRFLDAGVTRRYTEEGWVSIGATKAADGSSPDLFLHEVLARWDGWSLAAPRPGKTITSAQPGQPEQVTHVDNAAVAGIRLQADFVPEQGTLPLLRFGRSYRMRARAVDLAGNGPPADSADATSAGETAFYARFDPVPAPVPVLTSPPTPGESPVRLVIRSNYDSPAAAGTARHIAPPETSQVLAEAHGQFDTPDGKVDPDAYATIVAHQGTFPVGPDGQQLPQPQAVLDLPYLPDPLARSAALAGLPTAPAGSVQLVPFGGGNDWPGYRPFRLEMVEGTGPASWSGGVLTVPVPKAAVAAVQLSSALTPSDLELMGLWRVVQQSPVAQALLPALRKIAEEGRFRLLTPPREIVLVHAVQQPLAEPTLPVWAAQRDLGATYADLTGAIALDGASTGEIDIDAQWSDPVDLPSQRRWTSVAAQAHVDRIRIPVPHDVMTIYGDRPVRHQFGDTHYHHVQYTAVATTRFQEYFAAPLGPIDPTRPFTRTGAPHALDIPNSARPAAPAVLYVVPTFGWQTASKPGQVEVQRSGGGLRVYLDRPWFSSGAGEMLAVVLWPATPPPLGIRGWWNSLTLALGGGKPPEVPETYRPLTFEWGRDPVWSSSPLPYAATPAIFTNAAQTSGPVEGLTLAEAPDAAVSIAPFSVAYDQHRRLWYSDVEIDTGLAYAPFVRLALCRYQPVSVPGAHLSPVVLADFVQVAPDRSVAVVQGAPGMLRVTMSGPAFSGAGKTYKDGAWIGAEVEVTVEQAQPGVPPDLAWVPVPGATFSLVRGIGPYASPIWEASFALPQGVDASSSRLVLREYERLVVDGPESYSFDIAQTEPFHRPTPQADPPGSVVEAPPPSAVTRRPFPGLGAGVQGPDTARRLVFAAVLPLEVPPAAPAAVPVPAPTVTDVSPAQGTAGTTVTVTGTGFTSGAQVYFGATAATAVTVQSATSLTATAPAGTGTVDVTVRVGAQTSATTAADRFAYAAVGSAPTVTGVSPAQGTAGTTVTVTGTGFASGAQVYFGAAEATAVTVQSATSLTATAPAGTSTVDVTVRVGAQTSATTAADRFAYVPVVAAPTVTGVSPAQGTAGTTVTVTGTGFASGAQVYFGATAATAVTVQSATSLTATAPAGTGTVDVTVRVGAQTSATTTGDRFAYAPAVTGLSPAQGTAGTTVTVTGTGFASGAQVYFGATAATAVTVQSATSLAATAPAGTGTVDVTVRVGAQTSATTAADRFAYVPAVTGLSPAQGTAGTTVTVTGTGFASGAQVYFGGAAATGATVQSAMSLTATAPAGSGTVDVTVRVGARTSATTTADRFAYVPTVTGLSPAQGTAGTTVTVTGTGFASGAQVYFGATAATAVTVQSATSLTATVPAGTGTVDVTVRVGAQTSATTTADRFAYVPTVTGVQLVLGITAGAVAVSGMGFLPGAEVFFGSAQSPSVDVTGPTSLMCVPPAGTGTVDVTVRVDGQTSAVNPADRYVYPS